MSSVVNNRIYYPLLVSSDGTANHLSRDEDALIWKKYLVLSEKERNIITSHEIPTKLQELQKKFGIEEESIGKVSLYIRMLFFKELDLFSCEKKILELIKTNDAEAQDKAKKIVDFIDREILHLEPKIVPEEIYAETPPVVKTVRLPLLKAMSEYRHLSEQILTKEKIKLKSSMEPVRASLGNWLRSYREELGIGVHEPVLRGNFLFQSQNGKHLSNEERACLNLVLKSVEEGFPLEIDTEHETILFPSGEDASMELTQVKSRPMDRSIRPRGLPVNPAPVVQTPDKPSAFQSLKPLFTKPAAPEKNVSGETLHFSTGHVLPAERETPAATPDGSAALRQMQHPVQSIKREPRESLVRSPYSIRPLRSRNENTGAPHDTRA